MKKYNFDCDPGHDDAIAVILAAAHLDIIGLTTVGGNQTIGKVTPNALKVLEKIGKSDIPVFPGAEAPWIQELEIAPMFHGDSGLDGPVLPEPTKTAGSIPGPQFIVESVHKHNKLSMIATGPLTNIATALQLDPHIAQGIEEIFIMGGSATFGNWTPAAEFNIYVDPEAAYKVFNAGIPLRMSGLNLTRQSFFTRADMATLLEIDNPVAKFVYDLLDFFIDTSMEEAHLTGGNLHDVVAAAWAVRPALVKAVDMHVQIELTGQFTRGMTICDSRHLRAKEPLIDLDHKATAERRGLAPNCAVGMELDVPGFFDLMFDTLKSYS
jgi:pyrimidine-specific ribonucleoside hydrolase